MIANLPGELQELAGWRVLSSRADNSRMLLALLSDTHDNVANTQAGLALLAPHKPAAYLHAGDLVSASMLELFAGLPFYFVFGNNEYDHAGLRSRAAALGVRCLGDGGELSFPPAAVCLVHGHDFGQLDRAIRSGKYRYVIHGHTHVRRDERIGETRVINPGALHRAKAKTVALLDVASDSLTFLNLNAP
jgi:uncharacterized protein